MEHRFKVNCACICDIACIRCSITIDVIETQGFPHLAVHEMKENVHEVSPGINDMFREARRRLNNRHDEQLFALRMWYEYKYSEYKYMCLNLAYWLSYEIHGNAPEIKGHVKKKAFRHFLSLLRATVT